jgi:hypothetical protein
VAGAGRVEWQAGDGGDLLGGDAPVLVFGIGFGGFMFIFAVP